MRQNNTKKKKEANGYINHESKYKANNDIHCEYFL